MRSGREGLSNVKIRVVDRTKLPSTFRHNLWTLTTPSSTRNDFKTSSDSEVKSWFVMTPLQRFKVGWFSTLTWRQAIHFKEITLAICTSVRTSKRRVPFLCLVTDWTSPICCWRLWAKRQALTHFRVLPSSVLDRMRNLSLPGKPELKKLSKSTGLSTNRLFFLEEQEGVGVWREVAMMGPTLQTVGISLPSGG